MNNFPDNRNRVAVSLNDSTNNRPYLTNLIALRNMNNPGNSALNEAGGSKEKKAGVFPIRYIAVLGFQPYLKNTPSDQRRRKRFTHPRRIDHIPTFASLNHDKNTSSTHYTPNAGIELSETTPPPLQVNPVQKHA